LKDNLAANVSIGSTIKSDDVTLLGHKERFFYSVVWPILTYPKETNGRTINQIATYAVYTAFLI